MTYATTTIRHRGVEVHVQFYESSIYASCSNAAAVVHTFWLDRVVPGQWKYLGKTRTEQVRLLVDEVVRRSEKHQDSQQRLNALAAEVTRELAEGDHEERSA